MAFSVLVALPPEQLPVSVWLLSVVQVRLCVPLPLRSIRPSYGCAPPIWHRWLCSYQTPCTTRHSV